MESKMKPITGAIASVIIIFSGATFLLRDSFGLGTWVAFAIVIFILSVLAGISVKTR